MVTHTKYTHEYESMYGTEYTTHTTGVLVLVNAQRISKGMAWGLNGSRETLQNRHSDIRVNFQLVYMY